MTLVTINAVVDVSAYALMVAVSLSLQVAVGALEHREVARVRVARGADTVGIAMGHWEPGVIERSARPIRRDPGRMTEHAVGREASRLVIRVRRVVVIRGVTSVAIGRQRRVVVVHVAISALPRWNSMRPLQRERRVVVIEG